MRKEFSAWRKNKLRCELVRLQVFRVTAREKRERKDAVAAARLILLLLVGKFPTAKLAAVPQGVLLRQGHAYPDRRFALTYPFPRSFLSPSLKLRRRPLDRFRSRKKLEELSNFTTEETGITSMMRDESEK